MHTNWETHQRRMQRWSHNGLRGHTAMAVQGMRAVQGHPLATARSKRLARTIEAKLFVLAKSLETRKQK
jgi:hypothetical protein